MHTQHNNHTHNCTKTQTIHSRTDRGGELTETHTLYHRRHRYTAGGLGSSDGRHTMSAWELWCSLLQNALFWHFFLTFWSLVCISWFPICVFIVWFVCLCLCLCCECGFLCFTFELFIYSDLFASLFASLFSVRKGRPGNWKDWEGHGSRWGEEIVTGVYRMENIIFN